MDEFGSIQTFTEAHEKYFLTLVDCISQFADDRALEVSKLFDRDPLGRDACYFCIWQDSRRTKQFIRICAKNPLVPSRFFKIGASANNGRKYKEWQYSTDDGILVLRNVLDEAYDFLI